MIGADGAYSAVRQNIYKVMSEKGILPKTDSEDLEAGFTCMVGVTEPLDLEKYPLLKNGKCNSEFVLGSVSHSVSDNNLAIAPMICKARQIDPLPTYVGKHSVVVYVRPWKPSVLGLYRSVPEL